jgi:16S rRNA G966 N2-methylase RsmD
LHSYCYNIRENYSILDMEFRTEIVYLLPPYSYSAKSKACKHILDQNKSRQSEAMIIRRTEWLTQKDKERFEDTKDVNPRTEITMVKRKRTKGQKMTCKTLHRNPMNRTCLSLRQTEHIRGHL